MTGVVVNAKLWQPDAAQVLEHHLGMRCVGEAPDELAGSGCAAINVLNALRLEQGERIALLAAGEGSRLWGVSAAVAFVKGLVRLFGRTLIDQSERQARALLEQAPGTAADWVVLSGTDNVFAPQRPLEWRHCRSRGLYTFSVPVLVLDPQPADGVLERLAQLGILFVDQATHTAVAFREKPTPEQTLADLARHGARSVYVNAFVFAMSVDAARVLRALWSRPLPSTGAPLYTRSGFDWSAHVLAPLAAVHGGQVPGSDASGVFAAADDWALVCQCAQSFHEQFGPIHVLDAGADALWYDTGLVRDLHHLATLSLDPGAEGTRLRMLYGLPTPTASMVVRCTLGDGAQLQVGPGCVVSDCTIGAGVRVCLPANTVLLHCRINGARTWPAPDSQEGAMCYGLRVCGAGDALCLQNGQVYFSFADSDGEWRSGHFALHRNPKHGDCLAQPIEGVGESFRDLQRRRAVSIARTLADD